MLRDALFRPPVASEAKRNPPGRADLEAERAGRSMTFGSMRMIFSTPRTERRIAFELLQHAARSRRIRKRESEWCEDIADLGRRDIRSAGYVRAAREQDSVVAQNPFRPVVGKQRRHVLAGEAQDQ